MKKFVVITLLLILVVMLLRKPDKFIKLSQAFTQSFSKIWLSLVQPKKLFETN